MNLVYFGLVSVGFFQGFLRRLVADIFFLGRADFPHTVALSTREHLDPDAAHQAVIRDARAEHKFAVVREAVTKTNVRTTIWRRLLVCWMLSGPMTLLFCVLVVIVWAVCVIANPHILDWISPTCWYRQFKWTFLPSI